MRYTIKDFKRDFPDDKACLAHIFKNRYPQGLECPKCQKKDFYPVDGRRSYACACGFQVYPTEGTIFHKSPTSLVSWFHAIFLMSQSKNGVAAMEVMRQIGVTYKCAWRICKQIRKLMKGDNSPLTGIVEVDETYIGGKKEGRGKRKGDHTPVMGELQRGGDLKLHVIPDVKRDTLVPIIKAEIAPGAQVMTDKWHAYRHLSAMGYSHDTVDHGRKEYARGRVHTNSIEGFWSQLKRSITGTYHSVSEKHLQAYLDEFSFRYAHRLDLSPVPVTLFSRVGRPA